MSSNITVNSKVHPIVNGQPVTSVVGTVYTVHGDYTCIRWPWGSQSVAVANLHLIEPPFTLERGDLIQRGKAWEYSSLSIAWESAGVRPEDLGPEANRLWRKDPTDPDTMRCVWKREEQS